MFCKHCGTKNLEGAHYCLHDGLPLEPLNEDVQAIRDTSKFCQSCSQENELSSLYCTSCGVTLEKIVEKKNLAHDLSASLSKVTNINFPKANGLGTEALAGFFNREKLITAAKFAALAFGVVFLLSFILASYIDHLIKGVFDYALPAALLNSVTFISSTDVIMLSHLSGVKYIVSVLGESASLTITGGLIILLLIPASGLVLAGYLLNKYYPQYSAVGRVYASIPLAVIYAVLIGITSLVAGGTVTVPNPVGYLDGVTLAGNYQLFTSLIQSFLWALLFTTLGSMLGMPKELKGTGSNLGFGISIQRAVLHTLLGIIICIVITNVYIGSKDEFSNPYQSTQESMMKKVLLSQLGGYAWNLAHFNSITFERADRWDDLNSKYSFLGGFKESRDAAQLNKGFDQTIGKVWFFLLIPLLLHFWAGNELRKASTGHILPELGVYALTVGVINAAIFYATSFKLFTNFDNFFVLHFGFNVLTTFLFSAIIAFIIAYIGVMLTNRTVTTTHESPSQVSNY